MRHEDEKSSTSLLIWFTRWALDHGRDMYKCAPPTLQYNGQLCYVPSKFASELLCTNNLKHEKL